MKNQTKEKDYRERMAHLRAEAKKYTTIAEAMKKNGFAQTAYDHLVRGGTPPRKDMMDFPEKTQGELMSLEEIAGWIDKTIDICVMGRITRQDVETELQRAIANRDKKNRMASSLLYLQSIGKIPPEYQYLFNKG
jgi:hypothetical protein